MVEAVCEDAVAASGEIRELVPCHRFDVSRLGVQLREHRVDVRSEPSLVSVGKSGGNGEEAGYAPAFEKRGGVLMVIREAVVETEEGDRAVAGTVSEDLLELVRIADAESSRDVLQLLFEGASEPVRHRVIVEDADEWPQ